MEWKKLKLVGFFKESSIYKIARIKGNRDNILGIYFAEKRSSEDTIEVIEWNFPNSDSSKIGTSKEEVLKEVLSWLNSLNEALETDYQLSKIYYVSSENGSNLMYQTLLWMLLKHYYSRNKFTLFF